MGPAILGFGIGVFCDLRCRAPLVDVILGRGFSRPGLFGRRFLGLAVVAAMLLPLGQLTGWCTAHGPAIAPRPILMYAGSP